MTPNKLRLIVVLALLAVVLAGYFLLFRQPTIGDILATPDRFDGRQASIKGVVENPSPQGFWVNDGRNRIYVVTTGARGLAVLQGMEWQGGGIVRKDFPLPTGGQGTVIERQAK